MLLEVEGGLADFVAGLHADESGGNVLLLLRRFGGFEAVELHVCGDVAKDDRGLVAVDFLNLADSALAFQADEVPRFPKGESIHIIRLLIGHIA